MMVKDPTCGVCVEWKLKQMIKLFTGVNFNLSTFYFRINVGLSRLFLLSCAPYLLCALLTHVTVRKSVSSLNLMKLFTEVKLWKTQRSPGWKGRKDERSGSESMNGENSGDPAGQHQRCSGREQPEVCWSGRKAALRRPSGKRGKIACKRKKPKRCTKVEDLEKLLLEETKRKVQEKQNLNKQRGEESSNTSRKEFNTFKRAGRPSPEHHSLLSSSSSTCLHLTDFTTPNKTSCVQIEIWKWYKIFINQSSGN